MKPTIFMAIKGQGMSQGGNVLSKGIVAVMTAFGANEAQALVTSDVEADIAITDSLADALRMVKETETTTVVLAYFYKREQAAAEAFAGRYPGRVHAAPYICAEGEGVELAPRLMQLIADKTRKEA